MAVIRLDGFQIGAPAAPDLRFDPAAQAGAVGAGVNAIGQGAARLAEQIGAEELQRDRMTVLEMYPQFRVKAAEIEAAALKAAPSDGAGLRDATVAGVARLGEDMLKAAPNERVRTLLKGEVARETASISARALDQQQRLLSSDSARRIGDLRDRYGAMVRIDPSSLATAQGLMDEAIATAPGLSDAERSALAAQVKKAIPHYAILGEIDKDPAAALKRLQSGVWTDAADPQSIHHGIETAQAEIRRRDHEAKSRQNDRRAELAVEERNALALAYETGKPPALSGDFDAVMGAVHADQSRAKIDYAAKMGALFRSAPWDAPAALADAVAAMRPAESDPAYAIKIDAYNQAKELLAKTIQQRVQHPAEYVEQHPAVKAAWESGDIEGAVTVARKVADALGLRGTPVIAKARAEQMATAISNSPPGEISLRLSALERASGKAWPELMNAMASSGKLNMDVLALSAAPSGPARTEIEAALQQDHQLKQSKQGSLHELSKARGEDRLKDAYEELFKTDGPLSRYFAALMATSGASGDSRQIAAIRRGAELYAQRLTLTTDKSGSDIAAQVAADLTADVYLPDQGFFADFGKGLYGRVGVPEAIAPPLVAGAVASEFSQRLVSRVTSPAPPDMARLMIPRRINGADYDAEAAARALSRGATVANVRRAGWTDGAKADVAGLILNREARPGDLKAGKLEVYHPPANDGGVAEIGGITKAHHPDAFAMLERLPAEQRPEAARAYIDRYTAPAQRITANPGAAYLLADAYFHRGPAGSADIARIALGDKPTGQDWDQALKDRVKGAVMGDAAGFIGKFTDSRRRYEKSQVGERPNLASGLENRFAGAETTALMLSQRAVATLGEGVGRLSLVAAPDGRGVLIGRRDDRGIFVPYLDGSGRPRVAAWTDLTAASPGGAWGELVNPKREGRG